MNVIENFTYVGSREGADHALETIFANNTRVENLTIVEASDPRIVAVLRRILRIGKSGTMIKPVIVLLCVAMMAVSGACFIYKPESVLQIKFGGTSQESKAPKRMPATQPATTQPTTTVDVLHPSPVPILFDLDQFDTDLINSGLQEIQK